MREDKANNTLGFKGEEIVSRRPQGDGHGKGWVQPGALECSAVGTKTASRRTFLKTHLRVDRMCAYLMASRSTALGLQRHSASVQCEPRHECQLPMLAETEFPSLELELNTTVQAASSCCLTSLSMCPLPTNTFSHPIFVLPSCSGKRSSTQRMYF